MSLAGLIAASIASAAGGGAILGAVAAGLTGDFVTILLSLSLGALAGSAGGWFALKLSRGV